MLLTACAANKISTLPLPPAPVIGIDIVSLVNGQPAPFNGVEMSPFYLNEYLQYNCQKQGGC